MGQWFSDLGVRSEQVILMSSSLLDLFWELRSSSTNGWRPQFSRWRIGLHHESDWALELTWDNHLDKNDHDNDNGILRCACLNHWMLDGFLPTKNKCPSRWQISVFAFSSNDYSRRFFRLCCFCLKNKIYLLHCVIAFGYIRMYQWARGWYFNWAHFGNIAQDLVTLKLLITFAGRSNFSPSVFW